MELDLTGLLERSTEAPVASDSSAAVEESKFVSLELSLGWSSGEVGCRKRVRESDEAVKGKKPKMEEGPVPYGVQMLPVILQGPDGYCYACMAPYWVSCSMDVVENSVYKPGGNRDLAVEMNGVVAGDCRMEVSGGGGLSSTGCSNSGTSVLQSFSEKGESSSTNESRNHSNSKTTDNTSSISSFRSSKPKLKKPLAHTKGRRRPAFSRKRRTLVSTISVEGKKMNGYLYQCFKNEVRIQCSCHETLFSPADFIRHAGGPETQHPLRQITVVSS